MAYVSELAEFRVDHVEDVMQLEDTRRRNA